MCYFPGTGKTTTIINTIQEFQQKACGKADSSLTIHLNASDERGIDIIRNQISSFVSSSPLFCGGMKFVILDLLIIKLKTHNRLLNIYYKN